MTGFKPVTLEEVEKIWGNANFGPSLNDRKMDVVAGALLKWASGYSSGYTAVMGVLWENKCLKQWRQA